ncbi:MAG: hypothetical protein JWM59_1421 [Verrucomicrobiales bacterium]|nr:hypothetical protein [Verrucomicrobiales bacterium]
MLERFSRKGAIAAGKAELIARAKPFSRGGYEEKALASWAWRNAHFAHGEEGAEGLWGGGSTKGDRRTREYWTGLFAHGFGLCGTTHSHWTAEMEFLLGHGRGRGVGVEGHNSFEVFRWGAYGAGKWALLSIPEVKADVTRTTCAASRLKLTSGTSAFRHFQGSSSAAPASPTIDMTDATSRKADLMRAKGKLRTANAA